MKPLERIRKLKKETENAAVDSDYLFLLRAFEVMRDCYLNHLCEHHGYIHGERIWKNKIDEQFKKRMSP